MDVSQEKLTDYMLEDQINKIYAVLCIITLILVIKSYVNALKARTITS